MSTKKQQDQAIEVRPVTEEMLDFCVVGTSPFVCNAMHAKVWQDLVDPPKRKNQTERETTLKHNPPEEFRLSAYKSKDNKAETRIVFPAAGFKKALSTAALELPGVKKAQIGRLCWAEGHMVPLFGVPQIWCTIVRMPNAARTPDLRTRAIIPEWAARVTMKYVTPNLNKKSVATLLSSAGVFIGVGDGRPEKGALSFGRFKVVGPDDADFKRIVKAGSRKAQEAALANPEAFDVETEELLEWWHASVARKGFEVA